MKRLRHRDDLITCPRIHNEEMREPGFELTWSSSQIHGLIICVLPLVTLFVIFKKTSYTAFQDILELISVCFEGDPPARQGGRKKDQYYLRPIYNFPTAPRGTCDYPHFTISKLKNNSAKINLQEFERKVCWLFMSFQLNWYILPLYLHLQISLSFRKKSYFSKQEFFYLNFEWMRRQWGGLTGRKQATSSSLSPGAGSLFRGYSTLIMRDESQRGQGKMKMVYRKWDLWAEAKGIGVIDFKQISQLFLPENDLDSFKTTVAQGPSQGSQSVGLGSGPWALAWGQACMWL